MRAGLRNKFAWPCVKILCWTFVHCRAYFGNTEALYYGTKVDDPYPFYRNSGDTYQLYICLLVRVFGANDDHLKKLYVCVLRIWEAEDPVLDYGCPYRLFVVIHIKLIHP